VKRILLLTVLAFILPVLACSQTVATDPITVEWDGSAANNEIAIQSGDSDIISLGTTTANEYYIDLQSSGYYGTFVIMVRGYEINDGINYYSDWCRSDVDEDVIMIDGVAQTILYISVETPSSIRTK
jgi:hypothetical protein